MSHAGLANLVRLIHFLVVIFMVAVPFISNVHWTLLAIHVVAAVSLMFHWYLREDACILTIVESALRGVRPDKSFMHSIVSPLYKIEDKTLKELCFVVTPLLALVSICRLRNDWDVVRADMVIISRQMRGWRGR